MSVTVFGLSGLTNAYTSVLSSLGSAATVGASRWLEALPALGPSALTPNATAATAAAVVTARRARTVGRFDIGAPSRVPAKRGLVRARRPSRTSRTERHRMGAGSERGRRVALLSVSR